MMMLMILANLRWAARDQGLYENPGWHKPLHILNDIMYIIPHKWRFPWYDLSNHLWHRRYVWKGVNVANCRVKACARVVSGDGNDGESDHWEKTILDQLGRRNWWCCWQTLISLVLVMCPGRVGRGRRSYGGSWLQPANHSLGCCHIFKKS